MSAITRHATGASPVGLAHNGSWSLRGNTFSRYSLQCSSECFHLNESVTIMQVLCVSFEIELAVFCRHLTACSDMTAKQPRFEQQIMPETCNHRQTCLPSLDMQLELRRSDLLIMDLDRSEATHSVDTACSALLNVFI